MDTSRMQGIVYKKTRNNRLNILILLIYTACVMIRADKKASALFGYINKEVTKKAGGC
ncbi:hypothetical protein CBFG_05224 [Clostridiales bacterium 1_7_47FAA]|nr:hypothetical protein CBFG_05224 [Clostridiales bacterium 1_7_47FAA]